MPLLLLDSDIEENEPALHEVTDRLYGGGSEHRLRQELLLGIGGVRAVRAYCAITGHAEPEVFHTNEGHAGFLGVERIREYTAAGLTFDEALELCRAGTVFTTHTPVPAGIDRFPRELVEQYFAPTPPASVPLDRVLALGAETTRAATRTCSTWPSWACGSASGPTACRCCTARSAGNVRRAVAGLRHRRGADQLDHQRRARADLGRHARSPSSVTRPPAAGRRRRGCGRSAASCAPRLVGETRRRLRESWRQRGASGAELGWIDDVLDPDVLTIGFARRVPSYKRLTLMLRDPERLAGLLLDPERPVQIVIAGKAHPADDGGKRLIQQMVRFADSAAVRHRIVFLPDYDMAMARYLVWGCDVWLNNPLRPLEACGTSGMKAALNGGLNLSILDGWWDEWFDGENGWAIPTADGVADADAPRRARGRGAVRPAREVGRAAVLRPGRDGVPQPLDRDGAAHAAQPRPEGAGRPHGRAST